jgi:hypothetical protein
VTGLCNDADLSYNGAPAPIDPPFAGMIDEPISIGDFRILPIPWNGHLGAIVVLVDSSGHRAVEIPRKGSVSDGLCAALVVRSMWIISKNRCLRWPIRTTNGHTHTGAPRLKLLIDVRRAGETSNEDDFLTLGSAKFRHACAAQPTCALKLLDRQASSNPSLTYCSDLEKKDATVVLKKVLN